MNKHRTQRTWWDRLLSGVLCLALALGLLPAAGLVRTAGAAHWAEPYAEQLLEWGVMTPELATNLGSAVTRAEFVAMCNRAFGYTRLGDMPFTDVNVGDWYYEDINIAYNAGYFSGTSSDPANPKATPNNPLTREMAAVAVANNLMLQETVGESLGFTDSHDLHDWSRGKIGAAVAEGVISGYPDGSFRPKTNITRGELAALLVQLIGTPLSQEGGYELGDIYGNVVISSSNVTLRDTVILGNLYVTGGVDLGNVLLENVTVLGRLVVGGGGVSDAARSSVILRNVAADEMVVDSLVGQFVTISAYGLTDIPSTSVRSDAYLEDSCAAGYGLHCIELAGESGTKLQLAGGIKEVVNKTPLSLLQLVKGTAETITIDEEARSSELLVDIDTVLDTLNLDVATYVYGKGDIINLNIWADGCEVEILPEHVSIRPGLTAIVNGEVIGSVDADELSSAPRLLSGYPTVDSLRPTSAEGRYAVNKPGTLYWAVSAIADGSVSEANLINNPAYGGNILKAGEVPQSGSIDASSRVDYGRLISGLEPDGSYYISAIMVDERGNRSPVKVVSFTTPDDTVPAFVEEPHMTLVSCEVAQVTTMVNKNCLLYWVLLPAGAVAPTASNFRSGSFGGNYGSGSINVVKNVPVSVQVNTSRLQEKTSYDLYLWLNDLDGTLSSDVVKVVNGDTQAPADPSFTTPDETPPVVIPPYQSNFNETAAAAVIFAINEAPAELYWAVVTESDESFINDNMTEQRKRLKVEFGTGAIVYGVKAADGAGVDTEIGIREITGLDYATYGTHSFKFYYMARDAAGNYSSVGFIPIHTRDAEPPIVKLDDTDAMDGKYPADRNLRLIFSEQVKGSTELEDSTFVDLYNKVLSDEKLGDASAAKEALAKELGGHIELWYRPRTVTEVVEDPLGNDKNDPHGWIDWSEATVTLQSDGRVFLTLPAGKAVSLSSGMDYYFRFTDVYDHSYDYNLLAVTDENGRIIDGGGTDNVCELPFTTLYATVWLSKDRTGVSSTNEDGVEGVETIPLDIVFDVNPSSTSNMADTEFWDMVIWNTNNVPCKFIVYRSVNGGEWERVTQKNGESRRVSGGPEIKDEANIYGQDMLAVSLNHYKYDDYIKKYGEYETVKDGLKQGTTYKYAIHFTEVDGNTDRESWTSLLKMEIRLVAGERGNLRTLADDVNDVDGTYKRLVNTEKLLSEISAVNVGTNTVTYLETEKQFTDEKTPEFFDGYPKFDSTSSTITMQIAFGDRRQGSVYYVVAPVGTIPTSIKDGNGTIAINSDNDGTEDGKGIKPSADRKTYIPLDGDDITAVIDDDGEETHADWIYFKTGEENDRKYVSPAFGSIFAGSYSDPEGLIKKGSVEYTTYTRTERVPDLKQDTWYYVYMVLRSDSNKLDEVVQIYRVKTKEAQPPSITANRSGTSVAMKVYDTQAGGNTMYDNPELYYALVRKDDLPDWITKDKYVWTTTGTTGYVKEEDTTNSNAKTILEAMINQVSSTGKSYFDVCVDDDDPMRDRVLALITRATDEDRKNDSIKLYGPENKNDWEYDCKGDMSMDGEYVMLICARHADKDAYDASAYGFAAVQGLYRPDDVPPEFISPLGESEAVIDLVYDQNGSRVGSDWPFETPGKTSAKNYRFTGTLDITFSKPIYVYASDGVLKQVVDTVADSDKDKKISIKDVIAAPTGVLTDVQMTSERSFTLTFTQMRNGQTFIMSDLYNSGGIVKSNKTLVIKFDTSKTNKDLIVEETDEDPIEQVLEKVVPRFVITWQ